MCDVPPRTKDDFLTVAVEPLDVAAGDASALLAAMQKTAGAGRDLARAALIAEKMLRDPDCVVFLALSGPLVASGLKHAILALIERDMVDAVVATGANLIDQDLLEALGASHFVGSTAVDDEELRALHVDRIGDVFVDGDRRRELAGVIAEVADGMAPGAYSSRRFLDALGAWLARSGHDAPSILRRCHEKEIPLFSPALADSAAGPGLVMHRARRGADAIALDGIRDLAELTRLKVEGARHSGLLAIGGGVPKSTVQQTVAAAEALGAAAAPHRYAVQITVAGERGGGRSGASFAQACARGEVEIDYAQTVAAEATLALPLLVGALVERAAGQGRPARRLASIL
jgi:deoxyhypusine synthase